MRHLRSKLPGWIFKFCVGCAFLFLAAPVLVAFLIAFNSTAQIGLPEGFSLQWFKAVIEDTTWISAYRTSIIASLVSSVISLLTGTLFAYARMRSRFFGSGFLGTLAMSPLGMPRILLGIALLFFAQPLGLAGSFYILILGFVVLTTPYVIRVVGAVMAVYDPRVEEAAATLGADPIRTFILVTLPMIAPGLISAAILAFVYSFGNLQVAIFLVGPGQTTIPVQMFSMLEFRSDPTVAAVACINIIVVAGLMLIANRIVGTKALLQL